MRLYAYASDGTQYVPLANSLIGKFAPWLDLAVVLTPNRQDLCMNIFERCHAHNRIAKQYPDECTGWVDADVLPSKCPQKILEWERTSLDYDIALTHRPWQDDAHQCCAGVVLWPKGGGRGLDWLSRTMSTDPKPTKSTREQIYIKDVCDELRLRIFDLGEEYNDAVKRPETVIFHSDASWKPQYDLAQRQPCFRPELDHMHDPFYYRS